VGNQGDRQLGNQEAIKLKLDESPEQLDAPDQAISGNQWQSVAISGNEWPSVAIIGNHRLPNSTMLFSPLAKPRGPTICERPAVGDLPWPGEPISTLPPRHISKVGTLVHEALVQWGALDETRRLGRPVGVMTLVHLMTQRQSELDQSSIRAPSEAHQAQGGRG
jgi:hypothetical protein